MKKLIVLLTIVLCVAFVLATEACHRRHSRERYDEPYRGEQHQQHYPDNHPYPERDVRPGY